MQSENTVLSAPVPVNGGTGHAGDGTSLAFAGGDNGTLFDRYDLEQLTFRHYNPLRDLTAVTLAQAMDSFDAGVLMQAARIWRKMCGRDHTLLTVKKKREDSVALREWSIDKTEDSPMADEQECVLKAFYSGLRATHALKRHVTGSVSLLVGQMMDARAMGYATHHIIWKPDPVRTITLPSGKKMPGLSATLEFVPMEFFESRTGVLRFLGLSLGYTGQPLAPGNWLTTAEDYPLMQAASALYFFKRVAKQDLVNFSGKFGTPATLGHTTAAKDSPEGQAMVEAVKSVAANYRGVLFGAAENKIEHLWPSGGTSSEHLPPNVLESECKRDLVVLWLGEDLSTISRGGADSTGASLQGDATEKREKSDCALITEALNTGLDRLVIEYYFGPGTPMLAKFKLAPPINEDRKVLLECVTGAVAMGAQVPVDAVLQRLQVPTASEGDAVFAKAAAAPAIDGGPDAEAAFNALTGTDGNGQARTAQSQVLGKLLARARTVWPEALAADLKPVRNAIARVLQGSDGNLVMNADALYREIGALAPKVVEAGGSEKALYEIFAAAVAQGAASGREHLSA